MWIQILVLGSTLLCALMAIRASRLLVSALWLAGCSAFLALSIALLGAPEVGVVELSVGAGLVTVIFVFAISVAGEETVGVQSVVPRPVAWTLMALFVLLLAWLCVPGLVAPALPRDALPFLRALWVERSLDTVLQVAMIFSGVLGSLGLLAERREAGSVSRKAGEGAAP
ncbi:MAG TPA: NADH-quinone oxidoreductase subunit J [Spirochaetia bacterium]|nr:NADH-quinone oxidoreductase subunit J [Spirochaetia bacterium]